MVLVFVVISLVYSGKHGRTSKHWKSERSSLSPKGVATGGQDKGAASWGQYKETKTGSQNKSRVWRVDGTGGDEMGPPEAVPTVTLVGANLRSLGRSGDSKVEDHMFARGEEIAATLQEHNVDVAMVQEHKVSHRGLDLQTSFGNYSVLLSCSKRRWGGVGVFVHKELAKGIKYVQYLSPRLMWLAGTFRGYDLIIIPGYGPTLPRQAESGRYAEEVEAAIKKARKMFPSARVIYGTDFNGRVGRAGGRNDSDFKGVLGPYIGSSERNANGITLLQLAMDTGMVIANSIMPPPPPGTPEHDHIDQQWRGTFYMAKSRGEFAYTPDHMLVSASLVDDGSVLQCYVHARMFTETCSDHRPTVLVLKGKQAAVASEPSEKSKQPPRRDFAAMKDAKVNATVGKFMDDNLDPNMTYTEFVELAQEAADALLPEAPRTKTRVKGWFASNAKVMTTLLYEKRNAYDRYRDQPSDVETHEAFKRASNRLRDKARVLQSGFWERVGKEMAAAYQHGPGHFYETMKKEVGNKTTSVGSGVVGDEVSLDQVTEHFQKLLNPEESEDVVAARRLDALAMIGRLKDCSGVGCEKLTAVITLEELEKCLAACKDGKAVGIDAIPAEFLKGKGMAKSRAFVVNLLNGYLVDGKVPDELKDSILVPLYKGKGSKADLNNYRGLALLSHISKLFERILCTRLVVYFDSIEGANPNSQFGFMAGRGVADAILIDRLVTANALDKGVPLYKVYVDFVKAYDRVDRELLWKVLEKRKVPAVIISLIRSFHEGASAAVRVDGSLAEPFTLSVGLKQGSSLSPLLFNIFLGAIMEEVQQQFSARSHRLGVPMKQGVDSGFLEYSDPTVEVATHYLTEILFADDMAMLAMCHADLQAMVDVLDVVVRTFGQEISVGKTEVVVVVKQPLPKEGKEWVKHAPITVMRYGAKEIDGRSVEGMYPVTLKEVYSFKYLGSRTNARGTLADEVDAREQAMCMAWSTLKARVFLNMGLSLTARFEVYNAMVLSAGMYASAVAHHTKAEVARLDARHFGFLRQMVNGATYSSGKEEVIVKAAAQGVCIIPMELLMQQAQLRFAAHVERHHQRDGEIGPYLPRVIAHSSIAIPGNEAWGTKSGVLREEPITPSGYRAGLARAYEAFGGNKYGTFDAMAQDKIWWKEFVNIQGLVFAMTNWLVFRFGKRVDKRVLDYEKVAPILMAIDEETGDGWEPVLAVRPVASVEDAHSMPGEGDAEVEGSRAQEGLPVAEAVALLVPNASQSRRGLSRAQRKEERGVIGQARRKLAEAAAVAFRAAEAAAAKARKQAEKAVIEEKRRLAKRIAKEAAHIALVEEGIALYLGDITAELWDKGYRPCHHLRWTKQSEGRLLITHFSADGEEKRVWWFIPKEGDYVMPQFADAPVIHRVYVDELDRTAAIPATPEQVVQSPLALSPSYPVGTLLLLDLLVPASPALGQQHRGGNLEGGVGAEPGRRLHVMEDESEEESLADNSEDDRSLAEERGMGGSDRDTVGEVSDDPAESDEGGIRAKVLLKPRPGDFLGAGVVLIDYDDKVTLAAWKRGLIRRLRRKSLDPWTMSGAGVASARGAVVEPGTSVSYRLVGSRIECGEGLRKRRIEVTVGDGEGITSHQEKKRRRHVLRMRKACKAGRAAAREADGYEADMEWL